MPQTLVMGPGATTGAMGAANDGVWPEAQIRQTVDDAGVDCAVQN